VVAAADFDARQARDFLQAHCLECHEGEDAESDFRIDLLSADFTDHGNAGDWLEIRDMINLDEMPPIDEPRPDPQEAEAISKWIAGKLREAERSALANEGRVLMRRMNRHEYTHTLNDLLMMEFPTGRSPLDFLPADGTAEGFNKVSAALLLDPSLMRLYYDCARMVLDQAIVEGEPEFPTQTNRLEFEEIANSRAIRYLVTGLEKRPVEGGLQMINGGTRSFALIRYRHDGRNLQVTPTNGRYRFTLRAAGKPGAGGEMPRLRVIQSHPDDTQQLLMEFDLEEEMKEYEVVLPRDEKGGEIKVNMVNGNSPNMGQRPGEHFRQRNNEVGEKGDFAEVLRLGGRKVAEGWGGDRSTPDPDKLDLSRFPRAYLDYLEVEGPLYESWPPKFQKTYLGTTPPEEGEEIVRAEEAFREFLPRAWRRPVEPQEWTSLIEVVRSELEHGESFEEAMRVGFAAALTSPKFLFLNEPNPSEERRELNAFELATRLSYFLWSSMPDQRLFELASSGELTKPEVLMGEVDRMLADPKIERFVQGFAGQWLRTDTFLAFEPNKYLFEEYDPRLERAMPEEPLAFFRTVLEENLSLFNFIDSDFAVVNERLAEHYGIPGVEGDHFRKVALPPDSERGGLLAMAGVHLAGADGQRTKPVTRAVYVREVLFNDPPDPPPPNAGEIEPNIKGEKLTIRERLLQHQQIESCAACHRSIDPYGLALENFNVIGRWREQEDGEGFRRGADNPAIEASGRLPNGREFADFHEFRAALLEQDQRFRRGLAEKMMTYALGRPMTPLDDSSLQHITEYMAERGDTARSLVQGVVASTAFRSK